MKKSGIFYAVTAFILCLLLAFAGCATVTNGNDKEDDGDIGGGASKTYYTVTFDSQGGSAVESQSVEKGALASVPIPPTRQNYSLVGWFESADENAKKWSFDSDKVNGNITLYAKWQAEETEPEPEGNGKMYLTINSNEIEVTLADNSSAEALVQLLKQGDIVYTANDYGGFEKVGSLGQTLPTENSQITTEAGDVILYQGSQIVLFYGSNSWSYTRLGKINGYTEEQLRSLLCAGEGSVQITLSLTSRKDDNKGEEPTAENKILIVYFSATGTTQKIADMIISDTKGVGYEITPKIPYTADDLKYYTNCRADREQSDPAARPEISGSVGNMSEFSTIFLGYPIWHGQAPKIIYTFLESYDFTSKKIIPFCTSHSSPIGSSDDNLHPLAPNAQWESGVRFSGGESASTITQWLAQYGVTAKNAVA